MEEVQQQPPPAKIPKLSGSEEEEQEKVIKFLEERLVKHDENRKAVQDKLHEICEGLRTQICELEDKINKELEEKFTFEDNRLQAALNELRGNRAVSALQKARAELLVEQSYEIIENKEEEEDDENDTVKPKLDLTTLYELRAERRFVPEFVEVWKPINVRVTGMNRGRVSVEFVCPSLGEERISPDNTIVNPARYKTSLFKKGNEQESKEYPLHKDEGNDPSSFFFTPDFLEAETTYGARVKMTVGDRESEWSDEIAELTTPEFKECCVWKKCTDDADKGTKYSVDGGNPRVATKFNSISYCNIIGNTHIPLNKVTQWNIKVLKSRDNNGGVSCIGVAPSDINQNVDNCDNCGWYFECYSSTLWSGPPHNYKWKKYGPRKGYGQYVHTGDSVGVAVDTTKGDLSFILDGVNYGVAYEGIPLDKPLVPCVLLYCQGDSVELI